MASKLRPQQERLFAFLTRKTAGDLVTVAEILADTNWKPSTLTTYDRKQILDPFLARTSDDRYRVLREGSSISKGDVASAFTQKRPGLLVLTKGMRIAGTNAEYELRRYVGEGAVAHVWEATVAKDLGKYAIKVMNPRPDLLAPSILENVRKRFSREARHGMTLAHPNIVRHRDSGEVRGRPFLVMDFGDESLEEILRKGPMSLRTTFTVVQGCLGGLEYLHATNCVHRDIKPANILRFGERFVLGDLGIVHWSDMNPAFTSAATITRSSVQLGSWYYMAPEQRRSPHNATPVSDVYSLGVTWYQMLTGDTPDPAAVGARQFASPCSNQDVSKLIGRMLSFTPSDRPSVGDLLPELKGLATAMK